MTRAMKLLYLTYSGDFSYVLNISTGAMIVIVNLVIFIIFTIFNIKIELELSLKDLIKSIDESKYYNT